MVGDAEADLKWRWRRMLLVRGFGFDFGFCFGVCYGRRCGCCMRITGSKSLDCILAMLEMKREIHISIKVYREARRTKLVFH